MTDAPAAPVPGQRRIRWALPGRVRAWPAWVRWTVLPLLGLYVLYLTLGNVYINTGMLQHATNQKPEKFSLAYSHGVTLVPGHLIAWDVRTVGHVQHTVWTARARRASARIALLPLFQRTVWINTVIANDLVFETDRVDSFIAPPPRGTQGWTLHFGAIRSQSLHRVRLGKLAIDGRGDARFGFEKQIRGGPSEILPSEVRFRSARVSYDKALLLHDADIGSHFRIPRHFRDQAPGLQQVALASGDLVVKGRSAAIGLVLDPAGHVSARAAPGSGVVTMDLRIEQGQLVPGSHALWQVPLRGGDRHAWRPRGTLELQVAVDRDLRLKARIPRDTQTRSWLDADLLLAGRALPLQDEKVLLTRLSGRVQALWQFESLRWVSDVLVRKPWLRLDGAGEVDLDLRVAKGVPVPGSTLRVPRVDAVADVLGHRIAGVAKADGRILAGRDGTPLSELGVVLSTFEIRADDARYGPLFAGRDLRIDLAARGALAQFDDTATTRLRFAAARVPDLRAYNRYLPEKNIAILGGTGTASGDLQLDADGDVGRGWLKVHGTQARLKVADIEMHGDADVDARLRRGELARKRYDLSGSSVDLHGIGFADDRGDGADDWWGRLHVGRGQIDTSHDFAADAVFDAQMRDVGLLLSLFSRKRDYPKWAFNLADAGTVKASGQAQWRKDRVVVDRLHAENDRLKADARLAIDDRTPRGDLYVGWGVLGLGVELGGGGRKFHLLGARKWYDAQPDLLPAPP